MGVSGVRFPWSFLFPIWKGLLELDATASWTVPPRMLWGAAGGAGAKAPDPWDLPSPLGASCLAGDTPLDALRFALTPYLFDKKPS